MSSVLVALAVIFAELSLMTFGGGYTILPEIRRQVVDVQHWMTDRDFSSLFALAQAAPGPNLMIVPLIGWRVAGAAGLLVASVAKFAPSSVVTAIAVHVWDRFKDHPLRSAVQAGLVPVTAGLIVASAIVLTQASATSWLQLAIAGVVAAMATGTRIHPLYFLAGGAVAGAVGIGRF